MNKVYRNDLAEVYEILQYLDDESFKKIPNEILEGIDKNRNKDYEYFLNESLPFAEQEMLDESRAILFNLYRDYLTTPERRQRIVEYQNEELRIIEEKKREKFDCGDIFENPSIRKNYVTGVPDLSANENNVKDDEQIVVAKEGFFKRILRKIKTFLGF